MPTDSVARRIDDFLGSVHVLAAAITDVVEHGLLAQVSRGQMTVPQFKLLKLVAMANSHTIGDVASFLTVSNAAASKAVDRLVRRKLIRRTEDEKDRRAMRLSIAPPGERLLARYEAAKRRKLASLFGQYPPEELRGVSDLLDRLSAGIVDHSSNGEELCLKCGIYFRERCLVRQLVKRNCFYQRHKHKGGLTDVSGSTRQNSRGRRARRQSRR